MNRKSDTRNTCFALRANDSYYISSGECCALKWPDYRKMLKAGKCNTMKCPFYKPKRYMERCGDVIKGRHGEVIIKAED